MSVTKYLGSGESSEPVRALALVQGLVAATLAWASWRGWVSEAEVPYLMAVVLAAAGLVQWFAVRARTTPVPPSYPADEVPPENQPGPPIP